MKRTILLLAISTFAFSATAQETQKTRFQVTKEYSIGTTSDANPIQIWHDPATENDPFTTKHGICFLTSISGNFDAQSASAGFAVNAIGQWELGASTKTGEYIGAAGRCIIFASP